MDSVDVKYPENNRRSVKNILLVSERSIAMQGESLLWLAEFVKHFRSNSAYHFPSEDDIFVGP